MYSRNQLSGFAAFSHYWQSLLAVYLWCELPLRVRLVSFVHYLFDWLFLLFPMLRRLLLVRAAKLSYLWLAICYSNCSLLVCSCICCLVVGVFSSLPPCWFLSRLMNFMAATCKLMQFISTSYSFAWQWQPKLGTWQLLLCSEYVFM